MLLTEFGFEMGMPSRLLQQETRTYTENVETVVILFHCLYEWKDTGSRFRIT